MKPFQIFLREFSGRDLLRFCNHPSKRAHDYYDLYLKLPLPFGRETNVAAVLSMMILENAANAGMPIAYVHKVAPDIIFRSIFTLASNYENWHIPYNHPHHDSLIKELPTKLTSPLFVTDTFSFHERRMARYLIMLNNKKILTANSVDDIKLEIGAGAVSFIDADALAKDFRSKTLASLFNIA